MSYANGSPHRLPPPDTDLEAGPPTARSGDFDDGDVSDPFDITRTKNASIERLRRWRQAALVLNASRRFRYTLDLKKQEEKTQILRKIRAHAQAIRAAYLFKAAGDGQVIETTKPPAASAGEFPIGQEQLASVSREHDTVALQQYGGVAGISNLLKTNLEKGIHGDDADLLKRRNAFGSNDYPRKKGRSFWMFMWDACKDLTLIILMVAAAASLALGIKSEGIEEGWYDGGSIAFAVILVIVVTAISDYKQSLQFRNLNEEKRNIHLEVIRGGRRIEISIYEIVVGDVIPLNIGNQVPADGILITGHSLAIDESSMTGESKIVHKDSKDPFLMSGCKVADGSGTMLVTGVGVNTEWGLLMASISEDTGEETPLQVRLNGVATFIGIVGLSVAVVVLIVLLARFFSGHTRDASGNVQFKAGKTKVGDAIDGAIKIVTVAVTIVVVAVPEGLPLAVTLTLAYSMRKMMADKALVRRLSACETMGSATTICSDKTGTLTMNQMTVVEAYAGGKKNDPPGNKSELSPKLHSLLIEGVAQNTNGSVYVPEGGNDVEVSGSPTEKAILHWGLEIGMNFDSTRSESSIIHVFPFNSEKKRGGVAVQTADSEVHIHWKGAAEIVLACCTRYIDANDQLVDMDEEKDPCRPGVKDSVELCQKSGVKVVRWGRSVYANIQKFIQFQLTVNVAALVINVVAAVSSGDVPLNAVQLLWVNLIMDTLGALALATEPPTDHLMDRPPVGRREPLITNIMWRNLLIQAMYQVSVLLVLNFRGRSILGLTHDKNDHAIKVKNTLIFNAFVLSQIFNEFNARKPDEFNIFSGVTKNYLFMGIVGLTVVLQIIIIEFLGKFTSTVRLNWKQWLISVIIGFISWPLAVVGKLIPVPDTPINNVFSRFRGRRKEPEASQ
nr:calcium-transporting ATPase 8, plasma membrane-type isoform X6 [Arachis hypogaea]